MSESDAYFTPVDGLMSTAEVIQELTRRVETGVELLSERWTNGPHIWYFAINSTTLDIAHPENCVLGQLYGDYLQGLDTLDIDLGIAHGFSGAAAPVLTQIWKDKIRELRAAHVD